MSAPTITYFAQLHDSSLGPGHMSQAKSLLAAGYHPLSVSIAGNSGDYWYFAVWGFTSGEMLEYDFWWIGTGAQLLSEVSVQRAKGFFPVLVSATQGPDWQNDEPAFTAVFQRAVDPRDLNCQVFVGLASADLVRYDPQANGNVGHLVDALNGKNSQKILPKPDYTGGMYPSALCPYGPCHQANNPSWQADGVVDVYAYVLVLRPQPETRRLSWNWQEIPATDMVRALTAAKAGMFRPTLVVPIYDATTGGIGRYSVVWRDDSLAEWPAKPIGDQGFDCGSVSSVLEIGFEEYLDWVNNKVLSKNLWVLWAAVPGTNPGAIMIAAFAAPVFAEQPVERTFTRHALDEGIAGYLPGDDPLDQLMVNIMLPDNVRGAQLAIVRDGKLVVLRAYTNAETNYPPVFFTHRMRFASVSKVVTAMGAVKLAHLENSIDPKAVLDQPLAARIPIPPASKLGWSFDAACLQVVTIDHVVNYKSGFGNEGVNAPPDLIWDNMAEPRTIQGVLEQFAQLDANKLWQDGGNSTRLFSSFPGAWYWYSNFPFIVAQAVVETAPIANGRNLVQFTQDEIFSYLGIQGHRASYILSESRAAPYNETLYHPLQPGIDFQGGLPLLLYPRPNNYDGDPGLVGDGGWAMAAWEMARLLASLDEDDPASSGPSPLWSEAERALMLETFAYPDNQFGRGWDTISTLGYKKYSPTNVVVYHKDGGGAGNGSDVYYRPMFEYKSAHLILPTPGLVVVVVFNKDLNGDIYPSNGFQSFLSKNIEKIEHMVNDEDWPSANLFDLLSQ